jgi:hypothetical protein
MSSVIYWLTYFLVILQFQIVSPDVYMTCVQKQLYGSETDTTIDDVWLGLGCFAVTSQEPAAYLIGLSPTDYLHTPNEGDRYEIVQYQRDGTAIREIVTLTEKRPPKYRIILPLIVT